MKWTIFTFASVFLCNFSPSFRAHSYFSCSHTAISSFAALFSPLRKFSQANHFSLCSGLMHLLCTCLLFTYRWIHMLTRKTYVPSDAPHKYRLRAFAKQRKKKKRFEKNVHSMSVVLFEFFSIYRWSRWCVCMCIHSVQWLKKIKHEMELSAASATSFEKRLCAHRMWARASASLFAIQQVWNWSAMRNAL